MILPTKGIDSGRALLAVGAHVLRLLDEPKTVSRLWEDLREEHRGESRLTFDWFVLSVDLLFTLGLVDLERGRITRARSERP